MFCVRAAAAARGGEKYENLVKLDENRAPFSTCRWCWWWRRILKSFEMKIYIHQTFKRHLWPLLHESEMMMAFEKSLQLKDD
jgi:hypothetical protein